MLDKNTIRELIREEKMFRALAESSPDCIKLFDLDGDLLYINKGGLIEHRLESLEDAIGKNWKAIDTIIDEDKEKFANALQDAVSGKTTIIEIVHTIGGSTRDVCSEVVAPVQNEEWNTVAVLGISRDITQIKKAERKLEEVKEEMELRIREQEGELHERGKELEEFSGLLRKHETTMMNLQKEITELKNKK